MADTFETNRFSTTAEIHFIHAIRTDGGKWQARYLGMNEVPAEIEDTRLFNNTPIEVLRKSELAIFHNTKDWWLTAPVKYLDCRPSNPEAKES